MVSKTTLSLYRTRKSRVKEEKWFHNEKKCNIMMRARSNTLSLGWRKFGMEEEKKCKLCQKEEETLEHFLVECIKLQETRSRYIELQRPNTENRKNIMIMITVH